MAKLQLSNVELLIYAAVSILAALWCYYRWTMRHFLKTSAKIKMVPSYPIIGSCLEAVGSLSQLLKKIMSYEEKYCPEPVGMWFGPILGVLLSKPEDIQIILNNSDALDKGMLYTIFHEILGEGLIAAPVEKWKRDRRIIAPAFNSNVVQKFLPIFYENNKKIMKKIEREVGKTESFNLWDYILIHSTDVVCQTTMGYPTNMQTDKLLEFDNAIRRSIKLMLMRVCKPWLYPDVVYYIYKKLTKFDKIYKLVHNLPSQVINEKKLKLEQTNISDEGEENKKDESHSNTLLDILLNFNRTDANFSDNELLYQVLTIIMAGTDSSTSTLCFCLLLLAIHQNIQDKVFREIYDVLGYGDKIITFDEVNKLVYLDQVLKETLRLFTTVPYFHRKLQDDVKISSGGIVLPKGTIVVISANATHHLPELYPNPWTFNPDNFSQENIDNRHKYSFIPFSGGPRNCIGSKYAMLFMKIFLSMFLRNFSVHTVVELKDIELQFGVILKKLNGYPVTIQSRNKTSMQ